MSSASVLVVEDDTSLRKGMVALLEATGMTAIEAVDGEDALQLLRHGLAPSVILLDLAMPRMDGWHFRAQQTLDPRFAAIPVIIVSGQWNAREAGSTLAVTAVVPKPPDVDELLAAIEQARVH